MNYTPYSHLTDEEFVTHLSTKENPTDEEMEAMTRLELHVEEAIGVADLLEKCRAACADLRARSEDIRQRSNDLSGGTP